MNKEQSMRMRKDLAMVVIHCNHIAEKITEGGEEISSFICALAKLINEDKFFREQEEKDGSWWSLPSDIRIPSNQVLGCLLRLLPYREYLKTTHWENIRETCKKRHGGKCAVCNSPEKIEVHHRTYENLGCEKPGDVIPLCDSCHDLFHKNKKLAPPRS